jgi:hypothetical protein
MTKIRQLQNFLFLSHDHLFHVPQNSFNAWSNKALETANIKEFQVNWKCPPPPAPLCAHTNMQRHDVLEVRVTKSFFTSKT